MGKNLTGTVLLTLPMLRLTSLPQIGTEKRRLTPRTAIGRNKCYTSPHWPDWLPWGQRREDWVLPQCTRWWASLLPQAEWQTPIKQEEKITIVLDIKSFSEIWSTQFYHGKLLDKKYLEIRNRKNSDPDFEQNTEHLYAYHVRTVWQSWKKGCVDSVGTGTIDQDPHGSALIWLSWMWTQIRTRNADQNTEQGARKLTTKSD